MSWRLDPATAQQLDELALREHATFFIVRLAATIPVLAAATRQNDVVLGTYLTYRDKLALQNFFGPFIYLLPIRFRSEPDRTFRQWVTAVNRTMADFERHSAIPLETIYEELGRRGARLPAMQMVFNVFQQPSHHRLGDLELTSGGGRSPGMQTGFHMQLNHGPANTCAVYFDARVFDPAKVRPIVEFLARVPRSGRPRPRPHRQGACRQERTGQEADIVELAPAPLGVSRGSRQPGRRRIRRWSRPCNCRRPKPATAARRRDRHPCRSGRPGYRG